MATLSIFSVISRFLSFIYKVILSHSLTTSQLGVYSVATSIGMIFLTLLSSGLPLVISRTTAQSIVDNNHKKNTNSISSGIVISILLSVIAIALIIFLKPLFLKIFTDSTSYTVLLTLIPFLIFSALYAPIKGFLWGKERFFDVSIVEIVEQIVKILLCLILFAIIPNSNIPAGLSLSIGCMLSCLVGYMFYFKNKGKLSNPKYEFGCVFKQIVPITAVRMAGSLLNPLVSIILPLQLVNVGYTNSQAMSALGVIMGMTFPILTIPTTLIGSLAMAISPKLTILQKQNNETTLSRQILNSFTFTLFCCFLFIPIFSALGVPICEFLFHNSEAGQYLTTFSWILIPMGLCQITTSTLNSLGEEKFVFLSYFISSFVIILSILILPKYMGINCLLLGMGLQNCVVAILNYIRIRKLINSNSKILIKLAKFVIIALILTLLGKWLYAIISLFLSHFICLCFIGSIICLGYIMLCYAFGLFEFNILLQFKQLKASKKV